MFRTCQKRITTPVNIRLFDNDTGQYVDLDNKECVKYLGVLIDSHLSWRNHIDYISTKLSKTIGLFTKLRHSVPQHTLITLYWSLIHPYLNYVIIAWGQASKTLLNKLLLLQKLVLRFIFFVNWRDSAVPLFVKANIPPLNIMSCQSVANLVYDVVNENCPKNIRQLFLSIKDIHSYETRSAANGKLYTRPSRLKTQLNSFSLKAQRASSLFWHFNFNNLRPFLVINLCSLPHIWSVVSFFHAKHIVHLFTPRKIFPDKFFGLLSIFREHIHNFPKAGPHCSFVRSEITRSNNHI